MAPTYITPPLNTYSTSTTSGTGYPGDAATGHGMREFTSYIDELELYNTKFLAMVKKGKPVTQAKVEFGVRKQTPHTVGLLTTMTNNQTTMILASGDGPKVHNGMVILIPSDGTNAAEIVWVPDSGTNVSVDTVTIVRAQGGTSGVAHVATLVCPIIGVATTDNSTHPTGVITFGNLYFNNRQRFAEKIQVDSAEDIQKNWEDPDGGLFERRLEKIAKDLKVKFEKALLRGRRQTGAADVSAKRPPMLSGIEHFAELSTNTYALNSALFNIYDFETALRTGLNNIDVNFGDIAVMNYNTKAIIDSLPNIKRRLTATDTKLDLRLETVEFSAGSLNFLALPSDRWPDGSIVICRSKDLEIRPYVGLDWHFARQKPGVETDGDFAIGSISGDFTFIPEALDPFAWISGFDTTLANYPRDLAV